MKREVRAIEIVRTSEGFMLVLREGEQDLHTFSRHNDRVDGEAVALLQGTSPRSRERRGLVEFFNDNESGSTFLPPMMNSACQS